MGNRIVVVSDVHGCLEELDELLLKVDHKGSRLVFVGDLLDRGPDSIGVLRRVQELRAMCVKGNHEAKHLRYWKYEVHRQFVGTPNPMKPFSSAKLAIQDALTADDIDFLDGLPSFIRLGPKLCVVHAGCKPGIEVEDQEDRTLQHVRYLRRSDHKMLDLRAKLSPDTTAFWTDLWTGPDSIIYGHHPMDEGRPEVVPAGPGVWCFGIDTGCCFGGSLTALIFNGPHEPTYAQVKAKRTYVDRGDD